MLPWQPFSAFFVWGARWRHLANTTEPSMCGGDAALCQITLTTCLGLEILACNALLCHYEITRACSSFLHDTELI